MDNREKWDRRFLEMALMVSRWSKDPSTRCGAVIVRPDRTVASLGYNGFPRGVSDLPELYADREVKLDRVIHAEVNALLSAREPVRGYTLYTWPPGVCPSCSQCASQLVQSGIARVVVVSGEVPERWRVSCDRALWLYREAGVEVTFYAPATGGPVEGWGQ